MIRRVFVALACLNLAACAGPKSSAPVGSAAYAIIPPPIAGQLPAEYRIGPSDILQVTVFQEPELSNDRLSVDASGSVFMPLIGMIRAVGKTPEELAQEMAARLNERFLVNPQVSINLMQAVTQRVTIEGEVKKPGIYPIAGQMTLLQAVSLGEGMTDIAKTRDVIVFRSVGDQRLVARFDLAAIRVGNAADPEIIGNDIIVVGSSEARRLYRDALTILPALAGVFVAIESNN